MSERQEKRAKEMIVVDAYDRILFASPDMSWLMSDEYRRFINAWAELVDVYRVSDMFAEINVEVIAIYRRISEFLRHIKDNSSLTDSIRDTAEEKLTEMEFWMDELLREAERNLNLMEDEQE